MTDLVTDLFDESAIFSVTMISDARHVWNEL